MAETDSTRTYDLAGDIGKISLFGLLQFLEASRYSGIIRISSPGRGRAEGMLLDGAFASAECLHLTDQEALIAMLAWRSGSFGFVVRPDLPPAAQRIAVPSLLMEVARLEDEFERIAASLPAPEAPLHLHDPNAFPPDPLECGVRSVFATIAARPGLTYFDLERSLHLAPLKLRLSIAWLVSTGYLKSSLSIPPPPSLRPGPEDWYAKLLRLHMGGIRIAVAWNPAGPGEVSACVSYLAVALEAGPVTFDAAPEGPSFARIRPRRGGLLSLTFLPLRQRNFELYQAFIGTAGLVIFSARASPQETRRWEQATPIGVPRAYLLDEDSDGCLALTLSDYAIDAEAPASRAFLIPESGRGSQF